jgi:hypothetical protein
MQSSTTNINHERTSFELSVFVFEHDYDKPTSPEQFHRYTRKLNESISSNDDDNDDDDHLILSGRKCLFYVCKRALE